jgi:hypothetical protein
MGRWVSITRWTPEQYSGLIKKWETIVNGTAPKPVLDAWAKIKIITMEFSPANQFTLMVWEMKDEDWPDAGLCSLYMQDVAHLESYPVFSIEEWTKIQAKLPR